MGITGIATGIINRFSLEHCQVLTAADVPRLAKLAIVASMQPLHETEDMHFAESRIGPERLKYAYIWSDLLDLGASLRERRHFPRQE